MAGSSLFNHISTEADFTWTDSSKAHGEKTMKQLALNIQTLSKSRVPLDVRTVGFTPSGASGTHTYVMEFRRAGSAREYRRSNLHGFGNAGMRGVSFQDKKKVLCYLMDFLSVIHSDDMMFKLSQKMGYNIGTEASSTVAHFNICGAERKIQFENGRHLVELDGQAAISVRAIKEDFYKLVVEGYGLKNQNRMVLCALTHKRTPRSEAVFFFDEMNADGQAIHVYSHEAITEYLRKTGCSPLTGSAQDRTKLETVSNHPDLIISAYPGQKNPPLSDAEISTLPVRVLTKASGGIMASFGASDSAPVTAPAPVLPVSEDPATADVERGLFDGVTPEIMTWKNVDELYAVTQSPAFAAHLKATAGSGEDKAAFIKRVRDAQTQLATSTASGVIYDITQAQAALNEARLSKSKKATKELRTVDEAEFRSLNVDQAYSWLYGRSPRLMAAEQLAKNIQGTYFDGIAVQVYPIFVSGGQSVTLGRWEDGAFVPTQPEEVRELSADLRTKLITAGSSLLAAPSIPLLVIVPGVQATSANVIYVTGFDPRRDGGLSSLEAKLRENVLAITSKCTPSHPTELINATANQELKEIALKTRSGGQGSEFCALRKEWFNYADMVVIRQDGDSVRYSRAALQEWLKRHPCSLLTGAPLSHSSDVQSLSDFKSGVIPAKPGPLRFVEKFHSSMAAPICVKFSRREAAVASTARAVASATGSYAFRLTAEPTAGAGAASTRDRGNRYMPGRW